MGPVLILLVLSILNPINGRSVKKRDMKDVCLTQSCLEAALVMMKNMNEEEDPCDSFFLFACGNFEKRTIIPEDKSTVNQYTFIRDQVNEQLYFLFQNGNHTLNVFKKLQKYYDRCIDSVATKKNDIQISRELFNKLGDWPLIAKHEHREWDDSNFDWRETMYLFREAGLNSDMLVDISISTDIKNTNRRVIEVDQPGLGVSKEYIDKGPKSSVIKAYVKLMEELLTLYLPGTDVTNEIREIFQFETDLSKIMLSNKDRRNATLLYNPMSIRVLNENFDVVNWPEYINKMMSPQMIPEDEIVIVNIPKYLIDLCKLLEETEPRTLANYFFWRTLNLFSYYFQKEYKDARQRFTAVTTGKHSKSPKWKECLDLTSSKLALATGSLYVRNYFNKKAKKDSMDMIKNIRNEFRNIIMILEWMDDDTKRAAIEKLENMYPHIAYPDELLDDHLLENYYADMNIDVKLDSFLLTNLEISKFALKINVAKLREPVDRTDWRSHGKSSVVNAFYSPVENSIQFPAGVFQGMFYAPDRPKYMNYGSIGYTIGHEITHGFDDRGRQFDKNGVLTNWWNEETKENFLRRAKCTIEQYSNFTVKVRSDDDYNVYIDKHLNGNFTQGENIADNGGMKIAYAAYDAWLQENSQEQSLPGFQKYSSQQMFWFSAANKWCSKAKPEILENMILNDPHAPGKFRIDGPMMNIPEFSKDWNCPKGSRMNPVKKCSVWAEGIKIEDLRKIREYLH